MFIANRSLPENSFLSMVLYYWKCTEYAEWAQPLLLSRDLPRLSSVQTETDGNKWKGNQNTPGQLKQYK